MLNFVFLWMKVIIEVNIGYGVVDLREFKKKVVFLVCYNYFYLVFIVMLVYVFLFILY